MKLAIGSDHAGWQLKKEIINHLKLKDIQVIDVGTISCESVDYPDYAAKVAGKIISNHADKGILICGTGLGMAITANKFPGIRAVVVSDCFSAAMAREHNDANVLAFGARVVGIGLAVRIVDTFISTSYAGERHQCRLNKIRDIEIKNCNLPVL